MRNKVARERHVFLEFAATAGLLRQGSEVENRPTPEPDILLRHPSGETLAFELVEILDRTYSAALQREFDTMRLCQEAIGQLPPEVGAKFRKEFANAHISLSFKRHVTTQARRNALPSVLHHLLALPPGTAGKVDVPSGQLARTLSYITIDRIDISGPLFAATAATWVGDPTVEAIEDKLAKIYKTSAPLHLLAYIAGNPMFPDSVWMPKLDNFLSGLGAASQFAHIYVYDTRTNSIKVHWVRAP